VRGADESRTESFACSHLIRAKCSQGVGYDQRTAPRSARGAPMYGLCHMSHVTVPVKHAAVARAWLLDARAAKDWRGWERWPRTAQQLRLVVARVCTACSMVALCSHPAHGGQRGPTTCTTGGRMVHHGWPCAAGRSVAHCQCVCVRRGRFFLLSRRHPCYTSLWRGGTPARMPHKHNSAPGTRCMHALPADNNSVTSAHTQRAALGREHTRATALQRGTTARV
jgi:hypothetical protein